MSLDGFVTDPQDDAATSRIVFDEGKATGAVVTGRPTGDVAGYRDGDGDGDGDGDDHDGVPIFVPTHRAPADSPLRLVHYVTDGIEACVARAKEAAGDRDVLLHGAATAQAALRAGVLDVIEIQLRPVLLGRGRLLFDQLPPDHIELDLVRALEAPGVLHLRYEVRRR
ncbi:dihydrofolate reductase family protein [Nocardioides humi]|uniref:Dihydrofolate reductase family protein n=2 Tax=Nocardioides humi TaxID=449461 RepID=A0ABN1ZNK0_9ACTN